MPDIPRTDRFSLAYITRTFLQRPQEARATDGEHQGVRARSAPAPARNLFSPPAWAARPPASPASASIGAPKRTHAATLRFGLPHIDSHISLPGNPRASTKLNDPGPRSRGRDGKFSARNSLDSTADVASRSSAACKRPSRHGSLYPTPISQIGRSSRGFQNGRNSSIFGQRFITTFRPAASASRAASSLRTPICIQTTLAPILMASSVTA
jgi:hypothetical protein